MLAIGTQMRAHVYDLWTPEPEPIVPRDLCLGVRGRLDAAGEEVEPLDADSVRAAAAALRDRDVEAVAVMLLFSFINDEHERRVGEILAEELPGTVVSLSSRVVPEFREYVRASTTALNASLLPLMGAYMGAVTDEVAGEGVSVPLHMMQTNGGVAPAARARELPIALSASGPAAGVIGGARLAELVGERDALTFDMGGTTADIGLVIDGSPQRRFSGEAAGMPINLPADRRALHRLPAAARSPASTSSARSPSARPAPAPSRDPPPTAWAARTRPSPTPTSCSATCRPQSALADGVPLDRELAESAVAAAVGEPLGLGVEEAAVAILRIANANMANALRVMTIARGHDPRRFALVAIGGAGPMHACALADELGIPRVVIPRYPGVAAALGLLATDIRHDLRRSWLQPTAAIDPARPRRGVRASRGRGGRSAGDVGVGHPQLRVLPRARHALPRPGVQPDRAVRAAAGHGRDDRRRRGRVRGGAPPPLRLHADGHRDRHRDPAPARAGTDPRHRLDGRRGRPAARRRAALAASTTAAGASGRPPAATRSRRTIRSSPRRSSSRRTRPW